MSSTDVDPNQSSPAPAPDRSLNLGGLTFSSPQPPPDTDRGFAIGGVPFLGPMPQRPGPREPYIQSWPRPPNQWGRPDDILTSARNYPGVSPGPFMPQGSDVRGLLQQVLGGLGRIGSPNIAALALSAGRINAGWLKSFIQGREMAMKLSDAQFKRQMQQLDIEHQNELQDYGEIIAVNKSNPVEMMRQLRVAAATKYHDDRMIQAIDSGDPRAVERLLQERDRYWLNGGKYNSQTDKIEKEERRRQRQAPILHSFGIDPSEATGDDTGTPEPTEPPDTETGTEAPAPVTRPPATPLVEPPAEDEGGGAPVPGLSGGRAQAPAAAPQGQQVAQAQPAPAAAAAPGPQPGPSDPETAPPYQVAGPMMPPPTAPAENLPDTAATPVQFAPAPAAPPTAPGPPVNPQLRHVAHEMLMDRKPVLQFDKETNEIIAGRAAILAARMRGDLDRIRNDPRYDRMEPGARQDAVTAAIRAVDPELATEVQNYIDGAPTPRGYTASKAGFQLTFGLVRKADPTFDANNPNARANLMREYTSGQSGRTIISIATADDHVQFLKGLAEKLRPFQTYSIPFLNRLNAIRLREGLYSINSPQDRAAAEAYGNYMDAVTLIAPEVQRAQTGAAPTVSGIHEQETYLGAYQPVDQIIQHLDNRRELFGKRLKELRDKYDGSIGNPRLGISRLFKGFESRGGFEGAFKDETFRADPYAAPVPTRSGRSFNDALAGVGAGISSPRTSAPGGPAGGANSEAAAREWLRNNPNDPRAPAIRRALGL